MTACPPHDPGDPGLNRADLEYCSSSAAYGQTKTDNQGAAMPKAVRFDQHGDIDVLQVVDVAVAVMLPLRSVQLSARLFLQATR